MGATICVSGRLARVLTRSAAVLPISVLTFVVAPSADRPLAIGAATAYAAQLTATWTDNANGTAFFKVERKTGTTGTYTQIGTTPTGVTTYVDSTLATGTTYCYRVRASNSFGDSPYSNEACRTTGGTFDVTIAKSGTGAGTVVSTPTGISCGSDCFESFTEGRVVTLTATAATGSVFAGWSGGGCSGTAPCTTTGNAPVRITATFSPPPPPSPSYTLTITKSGTGAGTIVSSPAGISCGSDCSESVTAGTAVTLTATPAAGSTFSGWSGGGCSGTGTCRVTVNAATTVTATFTPATPTTYTLTVTKAGTGSGTVASAPLGIQCGADCSEAYASGTMVTLAATAAPGSRFTGWTGDAGCGSGLAMTANRSCTATFTLDSVGTPPPPSGSPCPCTIWTSATRPRLLVDPDRQAVELGVRFRASADGYITGIRFYKSWANTGTHVGRLWASTGALLGTVTFRGETASGWQQANFTTPVPITAGTTYIASYHTTVGGYSVDEGYFAAGGVTNGPLRALSNRAGGNGVYRYGPGGSFPNQTYNASNYWVDVVFIPR